MARPCSVCTHLERATIDARLAFQVVNVSELARSYGLGRDAVAMHRKNHLPEFLPAFQAKASTLTLDVLEAEAERLYRVTLDALARAEAGVLERVEWTDPDTGEKFVDHRPVVSITGVARMIREARAGLGQLAALAADRPDAEGRPSSRSDIDLGAAIRRELERTVARSNRGRELSEGNVVDEAELVDQVGGDGSATTTAAPTHPPRDLVRAAGGHALPPPFPLDSVKPSETPEDPDEHTFGQVTLTEDQIKTAAAAIGLTEHAFLAGLRRESHPKIKHPEWAGNPAASKEERAAEGYADIEVKDNRIVPDPSIHPVQ